MTSDIDIYRTTKLLIDQHSAFDAELYDSQRADELLEAGDMDGRGVWIKVLEAVRELTEAELPPEGTTIQ